MPVLEKPLFGPDDEKLQSLAEQLDGLEEPEAKEQALIAYLQGDEVEPSSLAEDLESDANQVSDDVFDLALKHGLGSVYLTWLMKRSLSVAQGPLERLPCAHVKLPEEQWMCPNEGKMACAQCKLVSYCSKECQKGHWHLHKKDCKDPIRSTDWQPAWIRERRPPRFASNSTAWIIPEKEHHFALGIHIWGNVPAMDTLNLANNEGTASMTDANIALAYVASGDLRNVLRTVNKLPADFSGQLTVLLNDREPVIALRNEALKPGNFFSLYLGKNSVISGVISESTRDLLRLVRQFEIDYEEAGEELDRVRFEPSRIDRHHRNYCRLQPSHRLAFLDYRRSGIVFPFGAPHTFAGPNKFLFSPNGIWLADDLASPLNEWNLEDVVAVGKAHGAQSADLYGCLYFYLSEQLRTFARRLQKFKISFKMFTEDARDLAKNLGAGLYELQGLPKDTVFDRIDVSNIIDPEYVGIPNILEDWALFLNKDNRHSAILGYSMNWVPKQLGSQPDEAAMKTITLKLLEMGKLGTHNSHPDLLGAWFKYYVALYDNSAAFEEYLKKQGADEAAEKAGVKRRSRHTVIPHRIGARIGDPSNALPHFPTEDSWYWNVQVGQALLSERFVEFSLA